MSVIEKELVKSINSGRAFALVGAGPSIEVGLPTWPELAAGAIELIRSKPSDSEILLRCNSLLERNQLPGVFSLVSQSVGDQKVIDYVDSQVNVQINNGRLYKVLVTWPFCSYLTTNFDDLLVESLLADNVPVAKKLNTLDDMRLLRSDSQDTVFKIHGETSKPEDLVLTHEQYISFQKDLARSYWREKLISIIHMSDLIIFGYGLSDPDFIYLLEQARELASLDHPIYMFASGFNGEEIKRHFLEYNIRIIPYDNSDGTHRDLIRTLNRYDPWIAKRGTLEVGEQEIDTDEAEIASSIFLFTNLRLFGENQTPIGNAYAAIILSTLEEDEANSLSSIELQKRIKKRAFSHSHIDPSAMKDALYQLSSRGFISTSKDLSSISLEKLGADAIKSARTERMSIMEHFEVACSQFLKIEDPSLSEEECATLIQSFEAGLTTAFRKRGLEIARSIFSDVNIDTINALDLLGVINQGTLTFTDRRLSTAYADLMMNVLLAPNSAMKRYLALLSQGYFAYHTLGFDPKIAQERLDYAKSKYWLLDASIIIPVLAVGCANHDYARDLISRLRALEIGLHTTRMLFEEVRDHAFWALINFKEKQPSSPEYILASTGKAGYRPNLFIDGYVQWFSTSGNPSIGAYFREIFGTDDPYSLNDAILSSLNEFQIEVLDFDEIPGFDKEMFGQRDADLTHAIQEVRERLGTFRSESQCKAEAEVVLISRHTDTIFMSLSTVLNKLFDHATSFTWKPEAIYRFLALFTDVQPDEDLLFMCMMEDFYSVGITIVDTDSLARFATPLIRQSRMKFETEKAAFEEALGPDRFMEFVDTFESTPDENKPFYSMQFAFYIASLEREKRREAEKRSHQDRKVKSLSDEERMDYVKLKGKEAEKRRKRLRKKRMIESRPKKKR